MYKDRSFCLFILCLILTSFSLEAQDLDRLYWLYDKPIYQELFKEIKENPANYRLLPLEQDIRLSYKFQFHQADEQGLYNHFDGLKQMNHKLRAEGYIKNKDHSIASGLAVYERGVNKSMAGRDLLDYSDFYPYLISTNKGGDYQKELYTIGGMYAYPIDNFLLALSGKYLGGIAYREADPRPENKLSSYIVGFACSYLWKNHLLSLYSKYNYYQQNLNILIRQAGKKRLFYSMRGFGLYDYIYSETSESYSRFLYKDNWDIGFSFYPKSLRGFSLNLKTSLKNLVQVHTHEQVPSTLKHLDFLASMSYVLGGNDWLLRINNTSDYLYSLGVEQQYKKYWVHRDPDLLGYKLLVRNKNYSSRSFTNSLSFNTLYHLNRAFSLSADYQLRYASEEELYRLRRYFFRYKHLEHKFGLLADYQWNKLKLELKTNYLYRKQLKSQRQIPQKSDYLVQLWREQMDYRQADYQVMELGLKASYPCLKNLILELSCSYAQSFGEIREQGLITQLNFIF